MLDTKAKGTDGIWPRIKQLDRPIFIKHRIVCRMCQCDLIVNTYSRRSVVHLAPKLKSSESTYKLSTTDVAVYV